MRITCRRMELIADYACARVHPHKIAAALGITPADFIAWRRRCLDATEAERAKYAKMAPPAPLPRQAPENPKIIADRVFETEPPADAAE